MKPSCQTTKPTAQLCALSEGEVHQIQNVIRQIRIQHTQNYARTCR